MPGAGVPHGGTSAAGAGVGFVRAQLAGSAAVTLTSSNNATAPHWPSLQSNAFA